MEGLIRGIIVRLQVEEIVKTAADGRGDSCAQPGGDDMQTRCVLEVISLYHQGVLDKND